MRSCTRLPCRRSWSGGSTAFPITSSRSFSVECSWPAAEGLLCIIFSCNFFRPAHNNITDQAMHHQILHKNIRPTSKPDQLRLVEARPEIQKSYILMAPLFCSNFSSQLEGVVQIPRGSIFASAAASAAWGGIIILTCMMFEIRSTNSLHS